MALATRLRWPLLVGLLLIVAALGTHGLRAKPIWYDEYWSLYYAGSTPQYGPASIGETWERVAVTEDTNPPGYYLLLNLWGQLAGWSVFATRAFSLLLGLLAVAWIYRLGADLGGPVAGIGAAVGLGLSAFFVSYTYALRAYALYVLLVTLLLWAYWRVIHARHTRLSAVLLVLAAAGLLYTHFMAVSLLAALGLYHLLIVRKDRRWWIVAGLAVLAGLLFLPWAQIALRASREVSADPSRDFYALDSFSLFVTTLNTFSNSSLALLAIFGCFALRARGRGFVIFLALGTLGLSLLLNAQLHFIADARYMFALWPLLALLVGLGTAAMARTRLHPALPLGLWGLAGLALSLGLTPTQAGTQTTIQTHLNWDTLAARLAADVEPGDAVIYTLPQNTPYWLHAPVAEYYLYDLAAQIDPFPRWLRPASPLPDRIPLRLHLVESEPTTAPADFQAQAETLLAEGGPLWMAYNPTLPPSPFALPAFYATLNDAGYAACDPMSAQPDLSLTLYARLKGVAPDLRFGEGINVSLLDPLPQSASGSSAAAAGLATGR